MDEIQQTQKAGEGSTLVQAGTVTINNNTVVGITEQRAREIYSEEMAKKAQSLALEAQDTATKRMLDLFSDLMARVKKCEKDLSAFSDPGFIQNVRIAQETAAVSDRKEDIETLSELLLARMNGALKRTTKTGIRKAMEIVAELEDSELMALSVYLFYAEYNLKSLFGITSTQYLSALNDGFSLLLTSELPQGKKWLHHLAILDAVIINPAEHFIPIENYYAQKTTGIICAGIAKGSQEQADAVSELNSCGISADILVDNELLPGFVRLPIVDLHDLTVFPIHVPNPPKWILLNSSKLLQESLRKIIALYDKDETRLKQVKQKFLEKMSTFETLMRVKKWFAELGHSFELTSAGTALAYVNARRCMPGLPIIELE